MGNKLAFGIRNCRFESEEWEILHDEIFSCLQTRQKSTHTKRQSIGKFRQPPGTPRLNSTSSRTLAWIFYRQLLSHSQTFLVSFLEKLNVVEKIAF